MADQYADFDDGTELHHDKVEGIQIRRRPVQYARLTAKQKEDIIRTASDAELDQKMGSSPLFHRLPVDT